MTSFPNSPKLLKAGLVLVDPQTAAIQRVIAMQYNPDSLSRSFQIKGMGENAERSQALRLTGPAAETLKIEAEIDAADQLENPDQNADAAQLGLQPVLAALEALVNPSSATLTENDARAGRGVMEIAPMETPLAVFVWSRSRIAPVRVTELSITEEAFDPALNPIRAKASLGLRILSVDDLGFEHRGGSLFMAYLRTRESLARRAPRGTLGLLGMEGLP